MVEPRKFKFLLGDRVRISGMRFEQLNAVGTVRTTLKKKHIGIASCEGFQILTDRHNQLINTCSCQLTYEEPVIGAAWSTRIDWGQCEWRPHWDDLPMDTKRKIVMLDHHKKKSK